RRLVQTLRSGTRKGAGAMLGRFHRFGPWLLSLFLIAQVGGVVPLISVDTLHEYQHSEILVISGDLAITHTQGKPDQHHHQGIHDEHDQCCALHHGLVGLVADVSTPLTTLETGVTFEPPPAHVISARTFRIDRPPRSSLPLI